MNKESLKTVMGFCMGITSMGALIGALLHNPVVLVLNLVVLAWDIYCYSLLK